MPSTATTSRVRRCTRLAPRPAGPPPERVRRRPCAGPRPRWRPPATSHSLARRSYLPPGPGSQEVPAVSRVRPSGRGAHGRGARDLRRALRGRAGGAGGELRCGPRRRRVGRGRARRRARRRPLGRRRSTTTARPWERDTIVNVFSTTKTMTALSRPAARRPRRARRRRARSPATGRSSPPTARTACSSATCSATPRGSSGWSEPMQVEDLYDWELATSLPRRPGAVVGAGHRRRATTPSPRATSSARSCAASPAPALGEFFAKELAGPLGADFHIGTGPSTTTASPPVIPPPPLELPRRSTPDSIAVRTFTNPPLDATESLHDPVAAGRDPGGRRPRQRPLGGHACSRCCLRRRGRRRAAAVRGRRRPRLRGAGRRHRPRARRAAAPRHRLRHQRRRGADRPERPRPASGAAGAARSSSTTSTPG